MAAASLQRRVFALLDGHRSSGAVAHAISLLFVATIAVCVIAGMALTVHELDAGDRTLALEAVVATQFIFLLEYLLRLWAAPGRDPAHEAAPMRARLDYLRSPMGLIDLVALLPGFLLLTGVSLWFDDVAALITLLKLGRYNPALGLLATVFRNERRPLIAALVSVFVLLILAAGIVYLLERSAQPDKFTSIPASMWWAITTMATVGYGDLTPVTPLGRMFGGFVMLLGIAMFAVPAGIMATGFASELRRRDHLANWKTVARLPLFGDLEASRIASIARLLHPEFVPRGHIVVRKGARADAMYFLMEGEVEVDVQPTPVRLGAGSHFGEIALLRDIERTATVITLTDCRLLSLSVSDFRKLMDGQPELRARLERTAEARIGAAAPPR
jgi:voltage-gated potassium channel